MATSIDKQRTNKLERYPVDDDGNLLHYPHEVHGYRPERQVWRSNEAFEATLTMISMTRGRSAAYLLWKASDGRVFPMFLSDLVDVLAGKVIDHGVVHGVWQVRKAGHNYGLALVSSQVPPGLGGS